MGGRGGSSASYGGSWRNRTAMEQATELAAAEYDKSHPAGGAASLEESIPDWVIEKKLGTGTDEAYAFRVGDGAFIKRETEKAYLIANNSDFGQVSFWMPKSWMSTPEKTRADFIKSKANMIAGSSYNRYLTQLASEAGVKVGNVRRTEAISKKLAAKGVKFFTKEEFKNTKGWKVTQADTFSF